MLQFFEQHLVLQTYLCTNNAIVGIYHFGLQGSKVEMMENHFFLNVIYIFVCLFVSCSSNTHLCMTSDSTTHRIWPGGYSCLETSCRFTLTYIIKQLMQIERSEKEGLFVCLFFPISFLVYSFVFIPLVWKSNRDNEYVIADLSVYMYRGG